MASKRINGTIMKRKSFIGKEYHSILESTRSYYREYAADYVKFYENWVKGRNEFSDSEYMEGYETIAKVLTSIVTPGESVIDVGCGVGKWSTLLAEKGIYVTSVDNLSSVLREFLRTCRKYEIRSRISLIMSDGFYLPFKNEVFDGATLNWVLAHIPVTKSAQFMNEVSRVVKHKGWLFISDSYWRGQEGGKEQVQTREVGGKQYEVYKYYYEPSELEKIVQGNFGEVKLLQPLRYELICVSRKSV